jgi:hypothetical protein
MAVVAPERAFSTIERIRARIAALPVESWSQADGADRASELRERALAILDEERAESIESAWREVAATFLPGQPLRIGLVETDRGFCAQALRNGRIVSAPEAVGRCVPTPVEALRELASALRQR